MQLLFQPARLSSLPPQQAPATTRETLARTQITRDQIRLPLFKRLRSQLLQRCGHPRELQIRHLAHDLVHGQLQLLLRSLLEQVSALQSCRTSTHSRYHMQTHDANRLLVAPHNAFQGTSPS